MSKEKKANLTTVYKKNGRSMEVNDDMLPHLESLGLSRKEPKAEKK